MTRDIKKIAKAEYLAAALKNEIAAIEVQQAEWAKGFLRNPHRFLSWADDQFKLASKHKALSRLAYRFEKTDEKEFTLEQIGSWYVKEITTFSAVPRSTSSCSNLVEQYDLQTAIDMSGVSELGGYVHPYFHKAQWMDAEFTEAHDAAMAEAKAEREAKEAAEAEAKREERNRKARERRLARHKA